MAIRRGREPRAVRLARSSPSTLFVVFAVTADVFATSNNIRNILVQITIVAVVAAGQTIVMLAGGLDLSVGSVVLFSEVVVTDLAIRRRRAGSVAHRRRAGRRRARRACSTAC